MKSIFLKKSAEVLMIINEERYLSQIARESGSTFPYVKNIIETFKIKGIIKIVPKGKFRVVKLTNKGKEILKAIRTISELERKS